MLATVLYNLEGHSDQSLAGGFHDVANGAWYAKSVAWAAANGILKGCGGGHLDPGGLATRAQAAQMMKNFIEHT